MIKSISKTITNLLLISAVLFVYVFSPVTVVAKDETLGDLKNTLKSLQAKEQANRNKKQKTQNEIKENKQRLSIAEDNLMNTRTKMTTLEEDIAHTNEEIERLKSETEKLLVLYQKNESENFYISYITGSSSVTELIMRVDALKTLTDYNNNKLNELELYIENSKKLSKELANYQVTLNKNIVAYNAAAEELQDELAELEEGAVTIQDEIKTMKELIKSYEAIGCKDDQLLTVCVNVENNSKWLKPLSKGRITSLYGKRTSPTAGASSYHRGIDIGVGEGTDVYPTANGVVGAIVRKSSCGGNMLYIWATVNGKPYTYVFMHLLSINVSVGDKVIVTKPVAKSGGGKQTASKYGGYDRCTTGAHLHYGLADGGFYGSSKSKPLSSFNANTIVPPGYPGLYQWFYSR